MIVKLKWAFKDRAKLKANLLRIFTVLFYILSILDKVIEIGLSYFEVYRVDKDVSEKDQTQVKRNHNGSVSKTKLFGANIMHI